MSGELCGRCWHAAKRVDGPNERGHFPDLAGRCVTKGCRCPAWVDAPGPDGDRFPAAAAAVVAFCRALHPDAHGGYGAATPAEILKLTEYLTRMVRLSQSDIGIRGDTRIPP